MSYTLMDKIREESKTTKGQRLRNHYINHSKCIDFLIKNRNWPEKEAREFADYMFFPTVRHNLG